MDIEQAVVYALKGEESYLGGSQSKVNARE